MHNHKTKLLITGTLSAAEFAFTQFPIKNGFRGGEGNLELKYDNNLEISIITRIL
jgi:hypothetical protein